MLKALPPLNALRAFEAAARHLSLTKAAKEMNLTAGALSHQIRGLEDLLGLKLFQRSARAISLTTDGKELYPGLHAGFAQIRESVETLRSRDRGRVLVISTPPGFTSKWLAPRLYRFSKAHPDIDVRISSTFGLANFTTDGVDVGLRSMPITAVIDPALAAEKLVDVSFVPVCSPKLLERHGPFATPASLKDVPLIHDVNRPGMPGWAEWFHAGGVRNVDVSRGLRFDSIDHALDAVVEGAGFLLAQDVLAYDELRTGRLVVPLDLKLRSDRAYHFVCAKNRQHHPNIQAFRDWIKCELAAHGWSA